MKYLGNCNDKIDWNAVIEDCKLQEGNTNIFWEKLPVHNEVFEMIGKSWNDAGIKNLDPAIEWTTYYCGKELDMSLADKAGEVLNATPWYCWISRIRPGKLIPWHIDDRPTGHGDSIKVGEDVRVVIYIEPPTMGHISITEEACVYMPAQGDMYQWGSFSDWHGGINMGLVDKWQFNFWGFRK
jgi:hypothetical protein